MIVVEVDRAERAHSILAGLGYTARREGGRILIAPDGQCEPARINATLVEAGFAVSHLATQHPTLEDLFLELTGAPAEEKEHAGQ